MKVPVTMFSNKLILLVMMIQLSRSQIFQKLLVQNDSLTGTIQKLQNVSKLFDKVKNEKDEIFSKRNQLLVEIKQKNDEIMVFKEKLIASKIQAAQAYRQYYGALMKCDSLKTQLKKIQESGPINDGNCFEFPISDQAYQIYVQYAQVSGFMNGSASAEMLLQFQNNFAFDLNVTIEGINNLIEWVKEKMIKTSDQKKLKDLKDIYDKLDKLKTKINSLYQSQLTLTQSKKIISDLQSKIYVSTTLDIIRKQIALGDLKYACEKNLAKLKQKLNLKLSTSFNLSQKVAETKTSLIKKLEVLKPLMSSLKQKTNTLKVALKSLSI